ncbi:hypothetical protein FHS97_002479 [Sphingomonas endophytica]|uniref:Uncharacterized protein n=1 Tax=Sphingomonas endophytica TaxID=869719 RepID=A0ABR6N905_9SPHN|nr:hypothetical protein [Sphingomonas endophytica]
MKRPPDAATLVTLTGFHINKPRQVLNALQP